ncbi:YggS family pyridoxal phosphate-dependent enzyme [Larsenimonas suaedae]|uniref:Pyridoxal phosphate homeostasis protein n=1 Tax=Larsenimonas suaedae TaxID=1851019 RepID=A0ABU1GYE3_9GAMM|nr:YggS family pyridoxal phosphate-dependent enzyme [Larsenimonas suaedae]MCM2973612.1 YggS family pyridoxal phosphate-dependent enzyme [Larsenimonas suaedae]MDR5897018.1 YggS family pyridoxal phosphate-dependent enzyme [Larsenimonas suaedae]
MSKSSVSTNIVAVRQRLEQALVDAGRPHDDAHLLAVSKTKPERDLRDAFEAGQRAFGENYLQEALDKQHALSDLAIEWHFIGAVQSNKARAVAEAFQWCHTVDRLKIARRLNDHRPDHLPPLNICLQVNISGEASKSGAAPDDVHAIAETLITLPRLSFRGLMALPAPSETLIEQRKPFSRLRELFESLKARHPNQPLDTLSMGMSGDLEAAIAEGATLVRVGSAIFGAR